jgi:histidinol-phosphate aminotransferase
MKNKFLELAAPGVQQLQPYFPGKPIDELERELGINNSIKLASNENPLGPSLKAIEAAKSVIDEVNLYPDGAGFKLSEALAKKHATNIDSITLGNGSNDVLELIARAFLTAEHSAVFSQYAFAVYPIVTQAIGAKANVANAYPADHPIMPYGHDLDSIYNAIDDTTRIVFIANPNNPTGTWLDINALTDFLNKVPDTVIVVLDEAYYEYMPDGLKPDSNALLKQFDNLILTRTFSKMYGLAGLRIGYSVSHPDVADIINRVRQPFNANLIAQEAALASLSDEQHVTNSITSNTFGLKQLADGFTGLGLTSIPSIGNFITVDVKQNAMPVYNALLHEGVIVRPVANYQLPNHLRITVGTESQNERALSALAKVLKGQ